MSRGYISNHIHFVFATKYRRPCLTPDIRDRLWQFIGGIARNNDMEPLAIGGYDDHCHALVSIPASMPLSKAVQLLKGGSSRWISITFEELPDFKWQSTYGAFSVSASQIDKVVQYINNQEEHHKKQSFENEYVSLLKLHNVAYDETVLFENHASES
ncbi:MAG TPA: IS200/IS605 family transposase [Candidatus Kapabacteria bacterium]|nr:IS200/IS605 family transposase [Candidatus Kapabacteria bacterium]